MHKFTNLMQIRNYFLTFYSLRSTVMIARNFVLTLFAPMRDDGKNGPVQNIGHVTQIIGRVGGEGGPLLTHVDPAYVYNTNFY
jgi:hypothetical protein